MVTNARFQEYCTHRSNARDVHCRKVSVSTQTDRQTDRHTHTHTDTQTDTPPTRRSWIKRLYLCPFDKAETDSLQILTSSLFTIPAMTASFQNLSSSSLIQSPPFHAAYQQSTDRTWLRWLFIILQWRRPACDPEPVYVGFVVGNVKMGQVFLRIIGLHPVSITPPMHYQEIRNK